MNINKNQPILDSNILIEFFCRANQYKVAEKLITNACYINDYILCESLNYIQKTLSTFASLKSFEDICSFNDIFQIIPTNESDRDLAKIILEKYLDNDFAFTDCLILSQAEQYGLKVYTSDVRMQNYKNVEVINPFED